MAGSGCEQLEKLRKGYVQVIRSRSNTEDNLQMDRKELPAQGYYNGLFMVLDGHGHEFQQTMEITINHKTLGIEGKAKTQWGR